MNLTNNGAEDDFAAWSPDGSRIAFASDRDGDWDIYVMEADGTGQTKLTMNRLFDLSPAWSSDGMRIAFDHAPAADVTEIYSMNADGSEVTRLTNNDVDDGQADWAAAGD